MAHSATKVPRLGVRAHDLGRFPPDELARRVADAGFSCVQLALTKALEGVDLSNGRIPPGLAAETAAAFRKHSVGIEVLGCYINPIHPDLTTRASLIALFKDHLRHAREFGCNIVALESGSLNPDYSPHPANRGEEAFLELLATMRDLVTEAEACGVVVGIEAVTTHVIHSPERMGRLLHELPSAHLRVVFDPVNLLSNENFRDQAAVIGRSLELFGDRIALVHAKDFRAADGRLTVCDAGTGLLDYDRLAAGLVPILGRTAIILEESSPKGMSASAAFLKDLFTASIS